MILFFSAWNVLCFRQHNAAIYIFINLLGLTITVSKNSLLLHHLQHLSRKTNSNWNVEHRLSPRSPQQLVLRCSHPVNSRTFTKSSVHGRWSAYSASSGTRSPLRNSSTLSCHLLYEQFSRIQFTSLWFLCVVSQRNSKPSPLHCPPCDLEPSSGGVF